MKNALKMREKRKKENVAYPREEMFSDKQKETSVS